jgi:hypothetical protein
MKKLKEFWKDPVWSKVISVGILGIISLLFTQILSITENLSFDESLNKVLNLKLKIIYIIGSIIIFWILKFIYNKVFNKNKNYYTKTQKQLLEFRSMRDNQQNLAFRWNTYFKDNGNPFISDLEIYCTNHGEMPIKFLGNNCQVNNCKNSDININEYAAENYIESEVQHYWDKLNGKFQKVN